MLSRDMIVDKALIVLAKTPMADFTTRKLAAALRITPGAMYRYFPSQEELLEAVFNRVLEGVDLSALEENLDWREVLKLWAHAYRTRQLQHPNTAQVARLDVHVSAMWFEISEPLISALSNAGFSGVALMNTVRFFSRSVVGAVIMELVHDSTSAAIERRETDHAMHDISVKAQTAWKKLYPYLGAQNNDDLFDFTLDHLIRGIEVAAAALQEKPSRKRKSTPL